MKKWILQKNTSEVYRNIKEYFEKLYSNKLENLEEMDKFLNTLHLKKLNQEHKNCLSSCRTSNEIEAIIKNYLAKKRPGLDGVSARFCQIFINTMYTCL
jgi:hypothetical protein